MGGYGGVRERVHNVGSKWERRKRGERCCMGEAVGREGVERWKRGEEMEVGKGKNGREKRRVGVAWARGKRDGRGEEEQCLGGKEGSAFMHEERRGRGGARGKRGR